MIHSVSDYKGEKGIVVAAEILEVVLTILADAENRKHINADAPAKMFTRFMGHNPKEMMQIFGILSRPVDSDESETEQEAEYTCDGAEALENMLIISNDDVIKGLFILQGQMEDSTPSASASESTEAPAM